MVNVAGNAMNLTVNSVNLLSNVDVISTGVLLELDVNPLSVFTWTVVDDTTTGGNSWNDVSITGSGGSSWTNVSITGGGGSSWTDISTTGSGGSSWTNVSTTGAGVIDPAQEVA